MPKDVFGPGYQFLPHDALLSFEEITRFAYCSGPGRRETAPHRRRANVAPSCRRLIGCWRSCAPAGDWTTTLTTNGSTLVKQAAALKAAGAVAHHRLARLDG